jgi:hypothetical protein
VVAESVPDVVDRVRAWRASVAAQAFSLADPGPASQPGGDESSQDDAAGRAAGSTFGTPVAAAGGAPLARVLHLPGREE